MAFCQNGAVKTSGFSALDCTLLNFFVDWRMLKKLWNCVFYPNANSWFQTLLDRPVIEKTPKEVKLRSSCDRSSKFCSLSAISSWQKRFVVGCLALKKTLRGNPFERWTEYFFPYIRYPISSFLLLIQGFDGQGCFIRMVLDQRFLFLVAFGDKNSFVLAFTNTTSHWVSQEKFPAFTAQSLPNHK